MCDAAADALLWFVDGGDGGWVQDGDRRKDERASVLLHALGNARYAQSVPIVARFAQQHGSTSIQSIAVQALAQINTDEARDVLLSILNGAEVARSVRKSSYEMLLELAELSGKR